MTRIEMFKVELISQEDKQLHHMFKSISEDI